MSTPTPSRDMTDLHEIAQWLAAHGRSMQDLAQELTAAANDPELTHDPAWRVVLLWISLRDFHELVDRLYWDAIEPDFIQSTLKRPPEQVTPEIARYAAELWKEWTGYARPVWTM